MEVPSNFKTLAAMTGGMTKSKMRRLKGRTWKFPLSFERQYTTSINRYFTKRWKEYASMAVQMMVSRMDAVYFLYSSFVLSVASFWNVTL